MLLKFALIVSIAGLAGLAQEIKRVPAKATSKASGVEMYRAYCSPCHGLQGKGDGPAAPALKKQPLDLSQLSRNNGGKFPAGRIQSALNEVGTAAHGSREMPIWGDVFRAMEHDSAGVAMRTMNLAKYIESLQQK
ncbi:MAG: c-type cytochrome [Bryobacteraceae bacterium]|nr:c-type cytochrome [Bryobacteraceae bacterium]